MHACSATSTIQEISIVYTKYKYTCMSFSNELISKLTRVLMNQGTKVLISIPINLMIAMGILWRFPVERVKRRPMEVSQGRYRDKHVVRVGVRARGLRCLGWTQEHKNHTEKTQRFILVRANSVPTPSN